MTELLYQSQYSVQQRMEHGQFGLNGVCATKIAEANNRNLEYAT